VSAYLDEFVQLNRTFRDLAFSEEEGKEAEIFRLTRRDKPAQWPELLNEPRVILLSEAGSGKTEEIRHVCLDLRRRKKNAFFLRIEHVAQDFEAAFEDGTPEEFERWITSGEEGWLLLDSVDEARLKDPKDFERAIRTIARKVRGVLQQAHIVSLAGARLGARRPIFCSARRTCRGLPRQPRPKRPKTLARPSPPTALARRSGSRSSGWSRWTILRANRSTASQARRA
jgi:hypothetical protein